MLYVFLVFLVLGGSTSSALWLARPLTVFHDRLLTQLAAYSNLVANKPTSSGSYNRIISTGTVPINKPSRNLSLNRILNKS